MMETIRILIADDQTITRTGIRVLLSAQAEIEIEPAGLRRANRRCRGVVCRSFWIDLGSQGWHEQASQNRCYG